MFEINYTSILVGHNFEGNQSISNLLLNWENSRTEGDLLMISSTLQDGAQPVPAPFSALGAASGFAFSRRLRQRIHQGRRISRPMA